MEPFSIHTVSSAPPASRASLEGLQKIFGFVPDVAGVLAASPTLLGIFAGVFAAFHAGTFTEAQIQTLLLTNAVTNDAPWAIALHTTLARKQGLDPVDIEAIRAGRTPRDPQTAALFTFSRALIDKRGHLEDSDVSAFRAAGFRQDQALEVIAGIAASALTNYVSSVARLPGDGTAV